MRPLPRARHSAPNRARAAHGPGRARSPPSGGRAEASPLLSPARIAPPRGSGAPLPASVVLQIDEQVNSLVGAVVLGRMHGLVIEPIDLPRLHLDRLVAAVEEAPRQSL